MPINKLINRAVVAMNNYRKTPCSKTRNALMKVENEIRRKIDFLEKTNQELDNDSNILGSNIDDSDVIAEAGQITNNNNADIERLKKTLGEIIATTTP